jgi:hypothetical protein
VLISDQPSMFGAFAVTSASPRIRAMNGFS